MNVLYAKSYFERELYIIEHENRYLPVYVSSGLNLGRKGRVLPFSSLAVPNRATLSGPIPGYIYKEFYFNKMWVNHGKDPQTFGKGIADFLLELEEYLLKCKPEFENYDHITSYKQIMPIARQCQNDMNKIIQSLEPFDWADLNDKDMT